MAATRSSTGNSKPRKVEKIEEVLTKKKPATKKRATSTKKAAGPAKTKANTSKPRAKKVASGKVTKAAPKKKTTTPKKSPTVKKVKAAIAKLEPAEEAKSEPTLFEKIEGVALKVQGAITGSTGKKAAGTAKVRGTDKKAAPKKSAKA